jgi:hypothetical protein
LVLHIGPHAHNASSLEIPVLTFQVEVMQKYVDESFVW